MRKIKLYNNSAWANSCFPANRGIGYLPAVKTHVLCNVKYDIAHL